MLPMAESESASGLRAAGADMWSSVLAFAGHAEAIGLDSLWPSDHFMAEAPDGPVEGVLEGWTVLSALAAVSSRIELGQMVMCTSYRDPGMLAKMASTAQAVSGGRVTLGVGAGWYDREYRAFGYAMDHRVDRFEEALQIIVPLLRGESVTFSGRYYRTDEARLLPPPAPSIPLLVAAKGPRMLRLTARYADAWNTAWFGFPDSELRRRVRGLESALEEEQREPSTLRRTVGVMIRDPDQNGGHADDGAFAGSVDELARLFDAYEELGFDGIVAAVEPMNERSLDRLSAATRLQTG